jgi:hypothetical protein
MPASENDFENGRSTIDVVVAREQRQARSRPGGAKST